MRIRPGARRVKESAPRQKPSLWILRKAQIKWPRNMARYDSGAPTAFSSKVPSTSSHAIPRSVARTASTSVAVPGGGTRRTRRARRRPAPPAGRRWSRAGPSRSLWWPCSNLLGTCGDYPRNPLAARGHFHPRADLGLTGDSWGRSTGVEARTAKPRPPRRSGDGTPPHAMRAIRRTIPLSSNDLGAPSSATKGPKTPAPHARTSRFRPGFRRAASPGPITTWRILRNTSPRKQVKKGRKTVSPNCAPGQDTRKARVRPRIPGISRVSHSVAYSLIDKIRIVDH